ncbi:MAG TPA: SIS domain-containing protein [Candidatus Paceibacterota bacterium]
MRKIKDQFELRRQLALRIFSDDSFHEQIIQAYLMLAHAVDVGRKILIFGNGGSAAQAQHFAAELVCQFEKRRKAIPAIALTTDSSILTAGSNDFGFPYVFARQIEALACRGDVAIGFTTSDVSDLENDYHSWNIRNAFEAAMVRGVKNIGFFSSKTKYLLSMVDVAIIVPNENTALIQEVHQQVIHILCGLVENDLPNSRF